jgi:type I restriction enzyme, R subunit
MSDVGKPERVTQNRVIALFQNELKYRYLGDWSDRSDNSNIEEGVLTSWLVKNGYTAAQISSALYELRNTANRPGEDLYTNNQATYKLLRYGVPVRADVDKPTETVHLINWIDPEANDFAIAEEVTLAGKHGRRPDIVLYVNGIAIGVLELKRSAVSIGEGIRQNLSNQEKDFHEWFFSTVQFVFAGNDTEGLKYGAIKTPEKFFMTWKEDEADNSRFKLDKYLLKICDKRRLLELMYDFVLFDGGIKKLPRVHQYFGIKAAQLHVDERKNGIIWHTQGSGKSIVMVLLAKWILEHNHDARVVVITDREELDKQIYNVFTAAGVDISRTRSGRDLMKQLSQTKPRLLCSLVHKFGKKDVDDFEAYVKEIEGRPSPAKGQLFVFVDECHRTQSGRLHRVMKALLPEAVFIGFTGTPLLKKDKQSSLEVFGEYIHTYKFSEAVLDKVVLDLAYEARDIKQRLGSKEKIDEWFEDSTTELNDWQKAELKKEWGTMQNVLSSKARMSRVVMDVVHDFKKNRRLNSGSGNALLVASSIYEACKYYEMFQSTPLKNKCALITSYDPQVKDITLEEIGENTVTAKQFIFETYTAMLADVVPKPGKSKTETYEDRAKERFIKEPAAMKLLIVVNKLLTGFDAPPCSVLYIDKKMEDHGLFQAICRPNRLDTEDKTVGFIVDYKNLFEQVGDAMAVYSSELDHTAPGVPPEVFIKDRLKLEKERLDDAIETLVFLCEPVEPPKSELEYIHYFTGNSEIKSEVEEREPRRTALYQATAALARAYADIMDEMRDAGYTDADVVRIKEQVHQFVGIRDIIRRSSGESLDLKPFEPDMRYLIDTYIEADAPKKVSPFEGMSLLDVITKIGIQKAIDDQLSVMKGNTTAIAETIENNVRKKIIKEHLSDPAYYATMSALLDEIIKARNEKAIKYEEYLEQMAEIAKKVERGHSVDTPTNLDTPAKRALWNNLGRNEELALKVDAALRAERPDGWRGVHPKEQTVKSALYRVLGNADEVERIFLIVKAQDEY